MSTGRNPRGPCMGALAGQYPDEVAIGLPHLMGWHWCDDFSAVDDIAGGRYGEKAWQLTTVGTGALAQVQSANTSGHEFGLRRLSASAIGDSAVLHQDMTQRQIRYRPPVGSWWAVKVAHYNSIVGSTLWLGFAESGACPDAATNLDFVGVRHTGAGNWLGVCKDGLNESVVDLGVGGSTSTSAYRILGFYRSAAGFHFFSAAASNQSTPPYLTWAAPTSTNHPNEYLSQVIGARADAAALKGLVVDWFDFGGRVARH